MLKQINFMKNKERIAILETEISRLKVANRNSIYRIEAIESHLAEQHKGANFSKLNPSEIPNTCEAVKPDFIPDWKDAPDWATCKAMDASGIWNWYSGKPYIEDGMNEWCLKSANDKYKLIPNHPPSDKDWTETLMMRPDASELNQAHKNVLVNVRSFEPEYTSEPSGIISVPFGLTDSEEKSFIEMKMKAMHDEFEIKRNEIIEKFKQPDALSAPDYTHLLPDGYEFCSEEDAEKWVKVEMIPNLRQQHELKTCLTTAPWGTRNCYRPIRPIQYKVTTHEIVTAVPDPYMPDWSQAPEWVYVHAFDFEGKGHWYGVKLYGNERYLEGLTSPFTLPADLDWKQSLRVKPN
jgi:hypothetical protein